MARHDPVVAQVSVSAPQLRTLRDRALRGTARGGLLNLFGAAVAGAGGLAITWLVAFGLGPQAAGQFFAATSAFLIATAVARLGTPTGLVYWVARCRAHDPSGLDTVLRAGLVPATVASLLIAVVAFAWAPQLSLWHEDGGPQFVAMLRALAVFLPAAVAMEALLAATRGFQRMRATVAIEKLGRTVAQLGLLWVAVSWLSGFSDQQGGITAVAVAWALPYLPAAVMAGLWLRRLRATRVPAAVEPPDLPTTARRFWAYTTPRAIAGAAHLILQRMDILLVAGMLGFTEAALYTVATRFVTVAQLTSGAIGSAVQPRLATSMSAADYDTAKSLYQVTTGWIVISSWPILLSVGWLAPQYLGVFGSEYVTTAGVTVVWLLVAGMLSATVCGVVDSVLVMAGRTGWQLYNVVVALAVNLGLNLWLIPSQGIVGAAIAWAVSLAVNNVIPLALLNGGFRLHPIGNGTVTAIGLTVGWFGVLPALASAMGGPGVMVAALSIGGIGLVASAWRSRNTLLRPARQ
ncbi:O-antigen/teichoic acid export membrane protein [Stackebrandtia endophytica]|uniref:O-antigen/teichoic acid export membrane protein n=1 Tax=Stackebrandtia endophytica TaxID=1496996 RepID=A0A543ATT2_9ACTN|nr:O-antigen/teichoic acid export membrane protein [Stackebrandtia endophytica]